VQDAICHLPQQLEILSIIPARSGSTEIKNKNIRLLASKPLIYYTIKESLKSKVTRTIVSTDDLKIAKLSRQFGAEAPFLRPKKFALSKSPSISVILHCLDYLKRENYYPDYVVFLQPTSPFRTASDINRGIRKIVQGNYVSLVGVIEVTQHPYWIFKKRNNQTMSEFLKIKKKPLRRQDLPKLYYINDALYITKTSYFEGRSFNSPIFALNSLVSLEMDPVHSIDINTSLDFEIATCLANRYRKNKHKLL